VSTGYDYNQVGFAASNLSGRGILGDGLGKSGRRESKSACDENVKSRNDAIAKRQILRIV
jgi:hypothetical protein